MLKVIEYDGNLKEIAQKLNNRKEEISIEVNNAVNDIINDIRKNGNQALINYCRKFDGYQIKDENDFVVSNQEKEEALKQVDQDYIRILERTKQQITEFHKNQIDKSWSLYKDNGVIMGQMVRPIERVALYVPGGTAAYPSTVLMNAIPAKLAGVKDLVIITPVKADGKVNPVIVAAAKVSGVNVIKTQIMVYAIAGMMYAFAAALEVGRIGSASNTTGNGYEMDAVAACVIGGVSLSGGVGSVGGIVIGVLMFTVINYGLAFIGVNMYWQYIVKGLIILLAVIIDMRKYAKRK